MGLVNEKHMNKEKDRFDEIVDRQLLHNSVAVRPDFERLQKRTDFSPIELTRLYSSFKQVAPNGALTEEQCVEGFALCFPHGNSARYARHVFRSTDMASKGYVTFEDLTLFIFAATRDAEKRQTLHWMFRLYDTDDDGCLSADNMLEIVESIYEMNGYDGEKACQKAKEHVRSLPFFKHSTSLTEQQFIDHCCQDEMVQTRLASAADLLQTFIS